MVGPDLGPTCLQSLSADIDSNKEELTATFRALTRNLKKTRVPGSYLPKSGSPSKVQRNIVSLKKEPQHQKWESAVSESSEIYILI